MKAIDLYNLFQQQVAEYHRTDNIDAPMSAPAQVQGEPASWIALLWEKSWVDTVQWHLEDLVRPSDVDPVYALQLKRRIDASNQHRTNLVEQIDDYYYGLFKDVAPQADARLNTETPAWAIDRLSILALKVYHFQIEAHRGDADHQAKCQAKLDTLLTQRADLTLAIDQLLDDLAAGRRQMKLYRQMKMYNDPSLNPSLYKK